MFIDETKTCMLDMLERCAMIKRFNRQSGLYIGYTGTIVIAITRDSQLYVLRTLAVLTFLHSDLFHFIFFLL